MTVHQDFKAELRDAYQVRREQGLTVSRALHDATDEVRSKLIKPLVVLDPESDDDIDRLAALISQCGPYMGVFRRGALQAALREFASPTPPKPDEPTNRWSVVVDRAGDQWVRALGPDFIYGWSHAGGFPDNVGGWTAYQEIDAVKVLSSGVEPGEPS